jgi:histidinol-phosphate aminotransferase
MPLPFSFNPSLKTLPVYQPGRPIEEVARELGMPAADFIKLASNENALGPSPAAVKAIQRALPQLNLYPDGNAFYLRQKVAAKLGVKPDQLVFGNGSNEILELLGHALLSPGDDVVASEYCFAVYPIVTSLFGANLITVPAKKYGHDLEAMLGAITPRTKLVFVANPNNPTGTMATRKSVLHLLEAMPPDVVLVMDEAYIDFADKPVDLLPFIRKGTYPNLILARTFSKIYGLAALRIGFGVAHPEFASALEKVRQPFNANMLAQLGAMAALDDQAHLDKTKANNTKGLEFFEAAFRRLKLKFVPSAANFILVRVEDGMAVFQGLQKLGVIVRPMCVYQLPEWIRITVGAPKENERCIAALEKVLNSLKQ